MPPNLRCKYCKRPLGECWCNQCEKCGEKMGWECNCSMKCTICNLNMNICLKNKKCRIFEK